MDNSIIVTIICLAYNQEKYIKQCLDGFVMQKTNFKFEVLINDDASTDGTADIIREYEDRYPNIIKPIYQSENQFSKGGRIGIRFLYPNIKGKYVAMCEGDDYWTAPYKLQKQVDFLEHNPDYSICFHPVKVIHDGYDLKDYIYPKKVNHNFTFHELLKYNFIQTNSVMYRWAFKDKDIDKNFPKDMCPSDWYLHLLHAKEGKIKILPDIMSVYRRNPNGMWSASFNEGVFVKYGVKMTNLYYNVYKNITENSKDYLKNIFIPNVGEIIKALFLNKKFKDIEIIYNNYPELIDKVFKNINQNSEENKYKKYKNLFNTFLVISVTEFLLLILLFIW